MHPTANHTIAADRQWARLCEAEQRRQVAAGSGARLRRPFGRRRAGLAIAGAALAIAVGTGCSGIQHRADLDPGWTCELAEGRPHVEGSVTNHSSQESTYWIEVSFLRDGEQFATRTAVVADVPAGSHADFEAGASNDPRTGDLDCNIVAVNRIRA